MDIVKSCQKGAAAIKQNPKPNTHRHRQLRQGELGGLYATIKDPTDKAKFIKLYFSPKVKEYINEKGILELPRVGKPVQPKPKPQPKKTKPPPKKK